MEKTLTPALVIQRGYFYRLNNVIYGPYISRVQAIGSYRKRISNDPWLHHYTNNMEPILVHGEIRLNEKKEILSTKLESTT